MQTAISTYLHVLATAHVPPLAAAAAAAARRRERQRVESRVQ